MKRQGYTQVYAPNANISRETNDCDGCWDTRLYPNGIFFLKPQDLDITPSGVKIEGNNYISYDLAALNAAMPDGTLAGKTIEIEMSSPINMNTNNSTLISFSSTSSVKVFSQNWYCSWGSIANYEPC